MTYHMCCTALACLACPSWGGWWADNSVWILCVRILACVNAHVRLQDRVRQEPLIAVRTGMWPLSTVTQKMNFMWGVAIKSFITNMASNGCDSRIGVNRNMTIKVFMLPIGLVAIRTFQWLNWRVSQMLVFQSGKLLDSHWSLLWREHGEDSVWCEGEDAWEKKRWF